MSVWSRRGAVEVSMGGLQESISRRTGATEVSTTTPAKTVSRTMQLPPRQGGSGLSASRARRAQAAQALSAILRLAVEAGGESVGVRGMPEAWRPGGRTAPASAASQPQSELVDDVAGAVVLERGL